MAERVKIPKTNNCDCNCSRSYFYDINIKLQCAIYTVNLNSCVVA